jgi:MFS family permease
MCARVLTPPTVSLRDSQSSLVVGLVGGSHVVNHTFFMLLPPIYLELATSLDVSTTEIGFALGLLGVVVTALQLPFGYVSDRYGRLPVLAISLGAGTLGTVMLVATTTYWWLILAQLVIGVGIAGHHPAHYPLLSAATDPGTRGRAYSIHGFTGAVGFAAPPALIAAGGSVGLVWQDIYGGVAVVSGVFTVGALWILWRWVDDDVTDAPPHEPAAAGATIRGRVGRYLRDLVSAPGIVLLTVLWLVTSTALWGIRQYTALLLEAGYAIPEADAGFAVALMLAISAALILVGGVLVDRFSPGRVLVGGYVAMVAIAVLLAWGALPVVAVLGIVLLFSATGDTSRPARATLADRFSPATDIGKNFGLLTIGISGGQAVAPFILSPVIETWGVQAGFSVIAALGLLALVLTARVLTHDHGAPSGQPQAGD